MKFRIRPTRFSILILCCTLALAACTSWQEQSAPAPAGRREIGAVRLTLNDGFSIVLENAAVSGDSIAGTVPGRSVPTAIALADVRKTEIRRVDPATTFWAGFLSVGAAFYAFGYVVRHSGR